MLARAAIEVAQRLRVSSIHVLFPERDELAVLQESGYMIRESVQFHWKNVGYDDFDAFLNSLAYDKRKKIRQQARKVAQADITFEHKRGSQITADDLSFFYSCYCNTYYERGRHPYLSEAFFSQLLQDAPESILLVLAHRDQTPVACAMNMIGNDKMYGRYWGAHEYIPGLHFETCYMQGIRYCIANGILVFEGGAQGEHKLSRGLLPQTTHSAHWIARPEFADAIHRFLDEEKKHVQAYRDELQEHSPFRKQEAAGKPELIFVLAFIFILAFIFFFIDDRIERKTTKHIAGLILHLLLHLHEHVLGLLHVIVHYIIEQRRLDIHKL